MRLNPGIMRLHDLLGDSLRIPHLLENELLDRARCLHVDIAEIQEGRGLALLHGRYVLDARQALFSRSAGE